MNLKCRNYVKVMKVLKNEQYLTHNQISKVTNYHVVCMQLDGINHMHAGIQSSNSCELLSDYVEESSQAVSFAVCNNSHIQQRMHQQNIEIKCVCPFVAIVTALAVATGTFTGGYIASARELSPLGSAKLVLVGAGIGILAFTASIFLGCPTPTIQGMPNTNRYRILSLSYSF